MNIAENKAALYRCIELFNKCTLEWVDTCYSKEMTWKEMPSSSFPKGRSGGFTDFRNAHSGILRIFPNRKLTVLKCVAENDYVVFEQDFRGTVAIAAGNYKIGDLIYLKMVTFFKLLDGLIIEHTDFPIVIC
jgi:SnoaL-like polyketide cyclase